MSEEVSGLVVDKFEDKTNHNYQTLIIDNNGERTNDIVLSLRNYGLFDSIRIGDKIRKLKGDSITYLQHSDSRVTEFKIDKNSYCKD